MFTVNIVTMTVFEIRKTLRNHGIKRSVKQVRVYLKEFGIEHLGIRQRPQQYPETAPDTILERLGHPRRRAA